MEAGAAQRTYDMIELIKKRENEIAAEDAALQAAKSLEKR